MTGKVVGVTATVDMSTGEPLSKACLNALRISTVTSRLLAHVRSETETETVPLNAEFCNLCLSLARGIDYAVSNNEIPGTTLDLPYLLKQVCLRKNDLASQAAVMVLMISVKSACRNGWFNEDAKQELNVLTNEIQSSFCSVSLNHLNSNVKNREANYHPTIYTIMSRFYPGMKMGNIFSLIETKPGYDSYVTDMYISKSSIVNPDDKIYLFVAQADNVATSSCLVTPQKVNFLLNGEGVHGRISLHMDPGPQMPTPVTHMLRYGSNLLQVVGQFNGRYIIVIGFMSVVSNPSLPILPNSDNKIIEASSRISQKCSISRIKIPVKGHFCKHLQCFDFNTYVEINSRRPLWRCPHCTQSVCFSDIRIDRNMVKVLKEVGDDVAYVNISGDGSWEAVTENISKTHTEKSNDELPSNQDPTTQNVDDIMDLKYGKNEDKKPLPAGEFTASHMEEGSWRNLYESAVGTTTTTTNNRLNPNARTVDGNRHQNYSQSHLNQQTSSHVQHDHLLHSSQSQRSPQVDVRAASPQAISGSRHTSPLSTDRFNSNQHQSLNQRTQFPVGSSGQPSPHLRVGQSPTYSQTMNRSPSPSFRPTIQTFGSSSGPVAATADQRGNSVNLSAEENWRPAGRMRGSLTEWQYNEALKNQSIIQPSQPVQAARAPPHLNTPRPFLPPQFQGLMSNNFRPQAGGSGPGSDSSMAGDPGSDK